MNEDNTRKLFKRFKFLNKSNMPDGFQCGDGWYKLVYDMCKELKEVNPPDSFIVTHIGERLGELEVHTKNGEMRTRVVIDEFNTQSVDLCDACGYDKDLEKCEKCTIPEIEYPDPEEDEEEEDDDDCSNCSTKGGCSCP